MIIFKEYHICEVSWKNWAQLKIFFKIFGCFSSPGGQNLKLTQKIPHFGKKKNLASIVAPRDKSPRAFLQNIITNKRTRGFLSSVNELNFFLTISWKIDDFFTRIVTVAPLTFLVKKFCFLVLTQSDLFFW